MLSFSGRTRIAAIASSILGVIALIAFGLASCGKPKPDAVTEVPRPDPLWSQFLESHTTGVISRHASIRVVFATDVVNADGVGRDAGTALTLDPKVPGSASFVGTRELVFTPSSELTPATAYRVAVQSKGLKGVPEKLAPFVFTVQVKRPEFEVSLGGLTADASSDGAMAVSGTLATADAEATDKVEKLLQATYGGQPITIDWQHEPEGQRHPFMIRGLKRTTQVQALKLQWSGEAIGAPTRGDREVNVPARGQFVITQVSAAEDGGQRYINVFFSDMLDRQQDLKGLVQLSRGNARTRVDGNVLRVYSDEAAQGEVTVTLERGIRNRAGDTLQATARYPIVYASTRPQVKFAGRGVILPEAATLSVPFEAVGVRSVRVTALQVFDDNVAQFLQVNNLDGSQELGRVGKRLWRKTIALNGADLKSWNRYSLDVTELLKQHPGGLMRITLAIRRENSAYGCEGETKRGTQATDDGEEMEEYSDYRSDPDDPQSWYYADDQARVEDGSGWGERDNPCRDAYYVYGQQMKDARNLLVSNIGLLAKKDQRGRWIVAATDLRTAEPLSGVRIEGMSYQNQAIGSWDTDARGIAELPTGTAPFTLIASKASDKGYLKVQQAVALPVSHFDVGGERVTAGLKGHIYGERGVWRPGDDIHLTFVLQDKEGSLPAQHPVTMELFNPQSQLTQTVVNTTPVGGFYAFTLKTTEDAPTGNWTAKATLGGATFSKVLKIETVMPNRLKVALDLKQSAGGALETLPTECIASPVTCDAEPRLHGKLFGQWLSGATAAGLKADVKMRLAAASTRFDRNPDFVFDDPARELGSEPQEIFAGTLDGSGNGEIDREVSGIEAAPGKLSATFTSRIFERGGAFSIAYETRELSPYSRYVGMRLPTSGRNRGGWSRDTLNAGEPLTLDLAGLTSAGQPTDIKEVEVTLYRVNWRWWWDRSGDSLAQYAVRSHSQIVQQDKVSIAAGKGAWKFQIDSEDYGRYLVRVCDVAGGHCTGKTFYAYDMSWAGRMPEQSGPSASVLVFTADKEKYVVGDTATLQLPETKEGRALLTIENGSAILDARWIDFAKDSNSVTFPITAAMAPNVYASVTLIQPHGRSNERPLRLYGVIPLHVTDPKTALAPVIGVASEWKPNSVGTVEVSERDRREMTYTLAVVDEGLLDLTSFKTPSLHEQFYRREALGVSTWDVFDEVAGAYSAEIERLLALGGSDAGEMKNSEERRTRFPPVVRYLGPFELKAGEKKRHEIQLPQYVGAVRVMVVAGRQSAYGSADKSVLVRQPLMLLPTLPRVLGPDEEVSVPVSVFVSDPALSRVTLQMETDAAFEIVGSDKVQLEFRQPQEQLAMLRLKSKPRVGKGSIKFTATGGKHRAQAQVYLDVRSPNPPTSQRVQHVLEAGESWNQSFVPHGLAGTNTVTLEVSAVPPLDLQRRLDYLIMYPYGCLEQTTSSVFPQLYLSSLVQLNELRRTEVQNNVQAGIRRLADFQAPNGGFGYWPGMWDWNDTAWRNFWSTTYAGHFLVEAKNLGYAVPESMLTGWVRFQRTTAQGWSKHGGAESTVDQAYRLYTLALAGQPEIGAMNRLREANELPAAARWMLASAYKLAGLTDAAVELTKNLSTAPAEYSGYYYYTFGSRERDNAITLASLVTLERASEAQPLAEDLARALSSDRWFSTHGTAFSLMSIARYVGRAPVTDYSFRYSVGGKATRVTAASSISSMPLSGFPDRGATVQVENTSKRRLFMTLSSRGVPASGTDVAGAAGLSMQVDYRDEDGNTIDVARVAQGTDLIARIEIANTSNEAINNIALAHMLPAGWEIHNDRLEGADTKGERDNSRMSTPWWWEYSRASKAEHVDIRDDRIYRHFDLAPRERLIFTTRLNAAYRGRFYLPSVAAEAMYDASQYAREKGQWVEVVEQPTQQ